MTLLSLREERRRYLNPTERSISHKVLLVDDDDAVRDMMTVTLERKGFDVVAAGSVTDALKHIATESFDVLITDLLQTSSPLNINRELTLGLEQ